MRFDGRVAIVTGGNKGIGLATAKRLGAEGARVVIVGRDPEDNEAAEQAVRKAGAPEVWVCEADVGQEEQVSSCVADTLERWGQLDFVVNNAGMMNFKPLVEQTADDWHRVLNVDLMGAFFFLKYGLPAMKPGSAVVNVSSIHALSTEALVAPYAAAKAALLSLTRSAAIEAGPKGIRVNAVVPGAIDTEMLWDNPNVKTGKEEIDPGQVGTPEDVAGAIAFLLSEEARFVTGSWLAVDGGRLGRL